MIIFGRNMRGYHTFAGAFNQLFLLLLGDFDYGEIEEAGGSSGVVFFYLFIMFSTFILLNFFLAIIMSSYDKANEILENMSETRKNTLVEDFSGAFHNIQNEMRHVLCRKSRPAPTFKDIVRGDIDTLIIKLRKVSLDVKKEAKERRRLAKESEASGAATQSRAHDDVITEDELRERLG